MLRRSIASLVLSATLATMSACAQDAGAPDGREAASGGVEAKTTGPAPVSVLAEASTPDASLLVQVVEAKHATPDTVRVSVAFTNKSAAPAEPLRDAKPDDVYLITADATRRVFLLRDAQNQPVVDGSLEPLQPGERRVLQLMFPALPAPPAQAARVGLHLGPLTLRDLPVSP